VQAFPTWKDDFDELESESTPIHWIAYGNYPSGDKERPSLQHVIEFLHQLNNRPDDTDWSSLKRQWKKRSPVFTNLISTFRQAEADRLQAGDPTKVYLDLVNQPDSIQGWTPFHVATFVGRLDMMKVLVSNGADPFSLTIGVSRTSLHLAVESCQLGAVEYVLGLTSSSSGAEIDINHQDMYGETALHIAVYRHFLAAAALLLKRKGCRIDLATFEGRNTPLHHAGNFCSGPIQTRILELLCSAPGNCPVDAVDDGGRPPGFLVLANPDSLRVLLRSGASLDVVDKAGASILHHACRRNHADALEVLLDWPSLPHALPLQPDSSGRIPLQVALDSGCLDCAKMMLQRFGPGDLVWKDGKTLVHRATPLGDAELLELCFKQPSFKPGCHTVEGHSTTQVAAQHGVFKARIRQMILHYESFVGPMPASDPEDSPSDALE